MTLVLMLGSVNTITALHFSNGPFAQQQMTLSWRNNHWLTTCQKTFKLRVCLIKKCTSYIYIFLHALVLFKTVLGAFGICVSSRCLRCVSFSYNLLHSTEMHMRPIGNIVCRRGCECKWLLSVCGLGCNFLRVLGSMQQYVCTFSSKSNCLLLFECHKLSFYLKINLTH